MGNNDWIYHYQSPYESIKSDFFSPMFDNWFADLPKMAANSTLLTSIKSTFMNGGYYRIDIDENIAVLAINSLMYNSKNQPDRQGN